MRRKLPYLLVLGLLIGPWAAPLLAEKPPEDPQAQERQRQEEQAKERFLDSPFDLKSEPKLTEGELKRILWDERYRIEGNRIVDLEAEDPDSRVLDGRKVQELLERDTLAQIKALRSTLKDGKLPKHLRPEALHILYERLPVIRDEKLRGRCAEEMGKWLAHTYGRLPERGEDGSEDADADASGAAAWGSLADVGRIAARGALSVLSGAGQDPAARAYAQLRSHVDLSYRNETERKGLEDTMHVMLRSELARTLSTEFNTYPEGLTLSYKHFSRTSVVPRGKEKVLNGTVGTTYGMQAPQTVYLEKLYLTPGVDDGRRKAAGVLAHEMLGHALSYRRAAKFERDFRAKYGDAEYTRRFGSDSMQDFYHLYQDNETNARLVGWVVEQQLGNRARSSRMWDWVQDPQKYYDKIVIGLPSYAKKLNRGEMAMQQGELIGTFGRRLELADGDRSTDGRWALGLRQEKAIMQRLVELKLAGEGDLTERGAYIKKRLGTSFSDWEGDRRDIESTIRGQLGFYAQTYTERRTSGGKTYEIVDGRTVYRMEGDRRVPVTDPAEKGRALTGSLSAFRHSGTTASGRQKLDNFNNAAATSFFQTEDRQVRDLTRSLQSLLAGKDKKKETAVESTPGQLTTSEIEKLYRQAVANDPDAWKDREGKPLPVPYYW